MPNMYKSKAYMPSTLKIYQNFQFGILNQLAASGDSKL